MTLKTSSSILKCFLSHIFPYHGSDTVFSIINNSLLFPFQLRGAELSDSWKYAQNTLNSISSDVQKAKKYKMLQIGHVASSSESSNSSLNLRLIGLDMKKWVTCSTTWAF